MTKYPRTPLAIRFEAEFGTAAARAWGFRAPPFIEAFDAEMKAAWAQYKREFNRQFIGA